MYNTLLNYYNVHNRLFLQDLNEVRCQLLKSLEQTKMHMDYKLSVINGLKDNEIIGII